MLFQMKRLVAGVDIDGAVTSFALVDEFGKIYAKGSFPTADYREFKNYVVRIKESIEALSDSLTIPHTIAAVGIGAPNSNYYTGDIENAANLISAEPYVVYPLDAGLPVTYLFDRPGYRNGGGCCKEK